MHFFKNYLMLLELSTNLKIFENAIILMTPWSKQRGNSSRKEVKNGLCWLTGAPHWLSVSPSLGSVYRGLYRQRAEPAPPSSGSYNQPSKSSLLISQAFPLHCIFSSLQGRHNTGERSGGKLPLIITSTVLVSYLLNLLL